MITYHGLSEHALSVHKSDISNLRTPYSNHCLVTAVKISPMSATATVTISVAELKSLQTQVQSILEVLEAHLDKATTAAKSKAPAPSKPAAKAPVKSAAKPAKTDESSADSTTTAAKRGAPPLPRLTFSKLNSKLSRDELERAFYNLEHASDYTPEPDDKGKLTKKSFADAILAHQKDHGDIKLEELDTDTDNVPKAPPKKAAAAKGKATEAKTEAPSQAEEEMVFDEELGLHTLKLNRNKYIVTSDGHIMGKMLGVAIAVLSQSDVKALTKAGQAMWHVEVEGRDKPATVEEIKARAAAEAEEAEAPEAEEEPEQAEAKEEPEQAETPEAEEPAPAEEEPEAEVVHTDAEEAEAPETDEPEEGSEEGEVVAKKPSSPKVTPKEKAQIAKEMAAKVGTAKSSSAKSSSAPKKPEADPDPLDDEELDALFESPQDDSAEDVIKAASTSTKAHVIVVTEKDFRAYLEGKAGKKPSKVLTDAVKKEIEAKFGTYKTKYAKIAKELMPAKK